MGRLQWLAESQAKELQKAFLTARPDLQPGAISDVKDGAYAVHA